MLVTCAVVPNGSSILQMEIRKPASPVMPTLITSRAIESSSTTSAAKVRRLRRQSEKTLGVAPLYQPQRESAVEGAL
jgi:hypothetical protein